MFECVTTVLLFAMFLFSVFCVVGILRNQEKRMEREFETKMAMAKAQSMTKDVEPFEKLREDIDYIISFYVAHEFITIDKENDDKDNRELLIEQLVSNISAKTMLSISDEMKRQFGLYATIPTNEGEEITEESFLTYFIRKESLVKVIARTKMKK